MFGLIRRLIMDAFDPVCQNKSAVMMGEYKGYCVRLRPKVDANGRVVEWVTDADDCARVDEAIAAGVVKERACASEYSEDAEKELEKRLQSAPNGVLSPSAQALPQPMPPALPPKPAFNPAGVPGI